MHAGRHYSLREVMTWTRRETFAFLVLAAVPTVLYAIVGWTWLTVPWLPIALVGTAVAFITGFKNNASYGRMWEARQIWGGIVNTSRAFGLMTRDYLFHETGTAAPADRDLHAAQAALVERHVAWMTALRYQLREARKWENQSLRHNVEYRRRYDVPELDGHLGDELARLLAPDECAAVMAKKNRATQILALQSHALQALRLRGLLSEFRHVELMRGLAELLEHQGKCERIKNFPYPRQFATLNLLFVWLFIVLVPLGLLQEFSKIGAGFVWLTIPASVVVGWVFHTMDKIGESSENPFEGGPNDVPITALARTIEIDLRELFSQPDIPPAVQAKNDILM